MALRPFALAIPRYAQDFDETAYTRVTAYRLPCSHLRRLALVDSEGDRWN